MSALQAFSFKILDFNLFKKCTILICEKFIIRNQLVKPRKRLYSFTTSTLWNYKRVRLQRRTSFSRSLRILAFEKF